MEREPDQIGERLQQARENAGWTVDDVVSQTRIPRTAVVALESGDFSVFPSPTYARSFLAQYSGFLGVDATLWLDALEPVAFSPGDVVHSTTPSARTRTEQMASAPEPGRGWMAAVGTLALTCGLIYAAVRGYQILDDRFGAEAAAPEVDPVKRDAPPGPAPEKAPAPTGIVENLNPPLPATEPSKPPPRAIIVR